MSLTPFIWPKTPRAFLRLKCVELLIQTWRPGRFVEMGAGRGDFTAYFLALGYSGSCYDLGEPNRHHLRRRFAALQPPLLNVVDALDQLTPGQFDYLFAFEVLEHIEHDDAALAQWLQFLRPHGRVLLSVPAHMRKFDRDDQYNGHVRRYEKDELLELLTSSGLDAVEILNYGFPLGNLLRRLNPLFFPQLQSASVPNQQLRSMQSGLTRRCDQLGGGAFLYPLLSLFAKLQIPFLSQDFGDGYLATGIKKVGGG